MSSQSLMILVLTAIVVLSSCSATQSNGILRIPLSQKPSGFQSGMKRAIEPFQLASKTNSFTISITNNYYPQFYGYLYVDRYAQPMVFDITATIAYIPNKDCKQCFSNQEISCSNFSTLITLNCAQMNYCDRPDIPIYNQLYGFSSGQYKVTGKIIKTYLSLPNINLIFFPFIHANTIVDLPLFENFGGVFPLSMRASNMFNEETFIDKLYNAGGIYQKMFSFYIASQPQNSELIFGGYDASKMSDSSAINYHKVIEFSKQGEEIYYWSVAGYSISIGNSSIKLHSTAALIDSTSTNIQVPSILFTQIVSQFQSIFAATYNSTEQIISVDCDADLPTLTIDLITIANTTTTYSIPKQLYMKQSYSSSPCTLLISPLPEEGYPEDITVVLGTTFLNGYISIFDLDNKQIGFSLSLDNPISNKFPWLLVILLAVGAILLTVGIFLYIRMKRKQKKILEEQNLIQQIQLNALPYQQF